MLNGTATQKLWYLIKRRISGFRNDSLPVDDLPQARNINEISTKIGIGILVPRLLLRLLPIITAWFGFVWLSAPVWDHKLDSRLGDNYYRQLSAPSTDNNGAPETCLTLPQPQAVDLEQDDEHVFIATLGHGIQQLDKDNLLWTTYDAQRTGGQLANDVLELDYQQRGRDDRLWALGMDGSITLGHIDDGAVAFERLFRAGYWRYFTREDISATLMLDDNNVVVGTDEQGAGVYNIKDHGWQDLPEIARQQIKRIIFDNNILWFLTNQGVSAYVVSIADDDHATFQHADKAALHSEDLIGLRVFSPSDAVAMTADGGCYLFRGSWSKKLLGGELIDGLDQQAITCCFDLGVRLIVAGPTIGVAAYDTQSRNWHLLHPGPIATIHAYDLDGQRAAVATAGGVITTDGLSAQLYLSGDDIAAVCLTEDGFIYLLNSNDLTRERVGSLSSDGTRRTLISNSQLEIHATPTLTGVVFNDRNIWIATAADGVLRYTPDQHHIELISSCEGCDSGQLRQVREIAGASDRLIALSGTSLYSCQWDGSSWTMERDDVQDVVVDADTGEMWLSKTTGGLIRQKGATEETWFSGQGPPSLEIDSTSNGFWAALATESSQPIVYLPDKSNRQLYQYNLFRGNWQPPLPIAGTHTFDYFAFGSGELFTLDSSTHQVFAADHLILSGGNPGFSLADAFLIEQKTPNQEIAVWGPVGRCTYKPTLGEWSAMNPYSFLDQGERITYIQPISAALNRRVIHTSRNRILLVDADFSNIAQLPDGQRNIWFDGSTFWQLTDTGSSGALRGRTITSSTAGQTNQTLEFKQLDYFAGTAPLLTPILEAWVEAGKLIFITTTSKAIYDPSTRSWNTTALLCGSITSAFHRADGLWVVTADGMLVKFGAEEKSMEPGWRLPAGDVVKLAVGTNHVLITMREPTGQFTSYYGGISERKWSKFYTAPTSYEGDLAQVVAAAEFSNRLWLIDRTGKIGSYANGTWISATFSGLDEFNIQGLAIYGSENAKKLYVHGRRLGDSAEFPVGCIAFGNPGLLKSLPAQVQDARIESGRFLWLKARNGDLFIYDLDRPDADPFVVAQTLFSAQLDLAYCVYLYFDAAGFTAHDLNPDEAAAFRAMLTTDRIEDVKLIRDQAGAIVTFFIKTARSILCYERSENQWKVIAECRSMNGQHIDDAIKRIDSCAVDLADDRSPLTADLRITAVNSQRNPVLEYLKVAAHLTSYDSQARLTSTPGRGDVTFSGITVSISEDGATYYFAQQANNVPLTHRGGRFAFDDPAVVDVTLREDNSVIVVRGDCIATYTAPSLERPQSYTPTTGPVPAGYIELINNRLALVSGQQPYVVEGTAWRAVTFDELVREQILYTDPRAPLQVTAGYRRFVVSAGGRPFSGGTKFPFDTLTSLEVSEHRVYLLAMTGAWSIDNKDGSLSGWQFFPFTTDIATAGPSGRSLAAVSTSSVLLRRGAAGEPQWHSLASDFPSAQLPDDPTVAEEDGWLWKRQYREGLTFSANINGEWTPKVRQGADFRFKDDAVMCLTAYDNALYVGHELGVTRITRAGKDQVWLLDAPVSELRQIDNALRARVVPNRVYKLTVGTGGAAFDIDPGLSAGTFDSFTTVHQDPLLTIAKRGRYLQLTATGNRPVTYDNQRRTFTTNIINGFAPVQRQLFVVSQLVPEAVVYAADGRAVGKPSPPVTPARFVLFNNELRAVTATSVSIFVDSPPSWAACGDTIQRGAIDKLAVEENLVSRSIYPVIDGTAISDFWRNGRFSFDTIADIETSGEAIYAASPIGVIRLGPALGSQPAEFARYYQWNAPVNRIVQRNGALHFKSPATDDHDGAEAEYTLNESDGTITQNTVSTNFVKSAFIYQQTTGDSPRYQWHRLTVAEQDARLPLCLQSSEMTYNYQVFDNSRLFWDQILTAAHEPSPDRYWSVTPRGLVGNMPELTEDTVTNISVCDFPGITAADISGSQLADSVYQDGILYTLHVDTEQNREYVFKREGTGWSPATDEEYPFWVPAVSFNLRNNAWNRRHITYSQFMSGQENFDFIGPEDYPLLTELEWAAGYGKFSFDALTWLHPRDNEIWAGSLGGLLKFRYFPDRKTFKVQLEQILLPEDGLIYYQVQACRPAAENRANLNILETSPTDPAAVQVLTFPSWKKDEQPDAFAAQTPRQISAYQLTYDPLRDIGELSLQTTNHGIIPLFKFIAKQNDQDRFFPLADNRYAFTADGQVYTFILPKRGAEEAMVPLEPQTELPSTSSFTLITTDSAGIQWGTVADKPALHLETGEDLLITEFTGVKTINVNEDAIVIVTNGEDHGKMLSGSAKDGATFDSVKTASTDDWVDYKPKPGTGISHYLVDTGLVPKQNFFKRLFGKEESELEEWIIKIAEENELKPGKKGKYDYQLEAGKTYRMPPATAKTKEIPQQLAQLVIGDREFSQIDNGVVPRNYIITAGSEKYGLIDGQFMRLEIPHNRVIFMAFPGRIPARTLSVVDGQISVHCSNPEDPEQSETWTFSPASLRDSTDIAAADFSRIELRSGDLVLSAADGGDLTVLAGNRSERVTRSGEWLFPSEFGQVVEISPDRSGRGYWVLTRSNGLMWTVDPS